MATTSRSTDKATTQEPDSLVEGAKASASDIADTVRSTAEDAVGRLPDAVETTRSAIEEANRQIQAGSDEMLTAGTTFAFGFAMGMLIGGANRLLVLAALIPAAVMGLTLFERNSGSRTPASRA